MKTTAHIHLDHKDTSDTLRRLSGAFELLGAIHAGSCGSAHYSTCSCHATHLADWHLFPLGGLDVLEALRERVAHLADAARSISQAPISSGPVRAYWSAQHQALHHLDQWFTLQVSVLRDYLRRKAAADSPSPRPLPVLPAPVPRPLQLA